MSKITNRFGLPEPLLYAVKNDPYTKGDSWRSVTQLISPPKITVLRERHEENIIEDVVERLYTLQGQIAHGIIERAADELKTHGWILEQRLVKEVLGKKISGQYDMYHPITRELVDVKYSSGWSAKNNEAKPEWIEQTNILAHLLRIHGFKVARIKILLLIRDWSKPEARRNQEYPQQPGLYLNVPAWDDGDAKDFLEERVKLHLQAEEVLPECSPVERWAKPSIWAIKKKGSTRAINGGLFADESAALKQLSVLGSGHEIEFRPGENTRCELYCNVSNFCAQHKNTAASTVQTIEPQIFRVKKRNGSAD